MIRTGIKGYVIWKKITRVYNVDLDNFFLICHGEEHLAEYLLKYLYSYMYEYKARRCIIITVSGELRNKINLKTQENPNIDVIAVDEYKMQCLLDAYWYKVLSDKVMVISTQIYGRNIDKLIGINGITEEDLIAAGLLNLNAKKEGEKGGNNVSWTFRVRT